MDADLKKSFVTYYLESLYERTRAEATGAKWGLDWVVYNLGLAMFGKPVRLPFLRSGEGEYAQSKNEAEFGVDLSFLSDDGTHLTVFVLKDEPLTNRTWTEKANFLRDLSMAMRPDLDGEGLGAVTAVTVVLAYNKDEEANGVRAYELFVKNAPSNLEDTVTLKFERWNLSELVQRTLMHVLTPALVPQRFFGQLSYLCAQAADFAHGSEPWERQLVPGWRRFLTDILAEGAGERALTLVPVALIILRQHAEKNRTIQTGFIDLTEWAAIALWRSVLDVPDENVRHVVGRFWGNFYIAELERFYTEQMPLLETERSIDQVGGGGFIGSVAASWIGYWHFGRLGLLSMAWTELLARGTDEERRLRMEAMNLAANWLMQLANANVCIFRPLLDIQHIEIYLAIMAWRHTARSDGARTFIDNLVARLYLRRLGRGDLPFLDGFNSLENVFEQVVTKPEEEVVSTKSSFFVLMLLELSCMFKVPERDEVLQRTHARLVLGNYEQGDPGDNPALDLISWVAPADWESKVLKGYVDDGEAVSLRPLSESRDTPGAELYATLDTLVSQMQKVSKVEFKQGIPLTALVLASLRHRSPLPPELWRPAAFPRKEPATA